MRALLLTMSLALSAPALATDTCSLDATQADIQLDPLTTTSLQRTDYGLIRVQCASGVPYQVEVLNAQPGGILPLVGAKPGHVLDAAVFVSDTGQPLGQVSFGEAVGGVGNGAAQSISIGAQVNPSHLPAADTYSATANINLIF